MISKPNTWVSVHSCLEYLPINNLITEASLLHEAASSSFPVHKLLTAYEGEKLKITEK